MRRRAIFGVVGLVLLVYLALVASPLDRHLGRSHPRLSAVLSPPFFNFRATYTSGRVLEFRIGMSRVEFGAALEGYSGAAVLMPSCAGEAGKAPLPLEDNPRVQSILSAQEVCLFSRKSRLGLFFHFEKELLSSVVVTWVTTEII